MAAVFPNVGKRVALDILLDDARNPKLRLFKNNVVPGNATVLGDLTPADFGGYAEVDLSGMAAAAINGSNQGFREKLANAFTWAGGNNTIYGWFVVIDDLAAAEKLLFAEKFAAPQLMSAAGDTITFNLTFLDMLGV